MIRKLLSEIEVEIKYRIYRENKYLNALRDIKESLNQIDFESEIVPVEDKSRLIKLFTSLKNEDLIEEEIYLIDQIVQFEKEKAIRSSHMSNA